MIITPSSVPRAETKMRFAVIQFPGSNCDQDCLAAINGLDGLHAQYVWHKETSLDDFDAVVLPGGFAYGDYLRCGAIARFSPIMKAVIGDARAGRGHPASAHVGPERCHAAAPHGDRDSDRPGLAVVLDFIALVAAVERDRVSAAWHRSGPTWADAG